MNNVYCLNGNSKGNLLYPVCSQMFPHVVLVYCLHNALPIYVNIYVLGPFLEVKSITQEH